jgi:peroxiredoxin Q/BCP
MAVLPAVAKVKSGRQTKAAPAFAPYACPDFDLPSSASGHVSRDSLKGQWFVLFLYPTDNTPTCTQENCEFSAALPQFEALGVRLFGLSKDSLADHAKFIHKYGLKMPLLSDESTASIDAFGSWGEKSLYGRTYMGTDRSTFVVDPQGQVRAEWRKVRIKGHIETVLTTVRSLIA